MYQPEPLSREMIRVMQDWYDGRDSMFFKVSIGASEDKKVKPVTKKQFNLIYRETYKTLSEVTDEIAKEFPQDVKALQSLLSWATRQSRIIDAREALRKTTINALKAGMTTQDTISYVENVVTAWAVPTD